MKNDKQALFLEILSGRRLQRDEAKQLMKDITDNVYNEAQLAAILSSFHFRKPSYEEILGFQEALLEQCIPVELPFSKVLDMCGTGGDGKSSFNISTLAAFVVAATGCKVAKHGNNGVSSICGSSNVLRELGYQFKENTQELAEELDTLGITFLHAPFFHPALRHVAGVRKNLGVKTIFNLMGPLVHPSQPSYQFTGVYNLEVARLYDYVLQNTRKAYMVVHALDGYDEISLTGPAKYYSHSGQGMQLVEDLGITSIHPNLLMSGKSIAEAANIFTEVLKGRGLTAQRQVVCANAASAYRLIHPSVPLKDAFQICLDVLEGGKVYELFQKLTQQTTKIALS